MGGSGRRCPRVPLQLPADTQASQEQGRSPGPDVDTRETRSQRPSDSRFLPGQLPPSERPPSVGLGSAQPRTGPQPGWPLARTSFQKAKLNAPKRPRPVSAPRIPDTSEPRLPKETTFQASAASPTPAAPGVWQTQSLRTARDAWAPPRVRSSHCRAEPRKPHFPACLARPRRRREPPLVSMGTSPRSVPAAEPWSAKLRLPLRCPGSRTGSAAGESGGLAGRRPGGPDAPRRPGARALLGPPRSEAKGSGEAKPAWVPGARSPPAPRRRLVTPGRGPRPLPGVPGVAGAAGGRAGSARSPPSAPGLGPGFAPAAPGPGAHPSGLQIPIL